MAKAKTIKKRGARKVPAPKAAKPGFLTGRDLTVPLLSLGLLAITWIVFGRTLSFDFVNYDDSFYVYQNSFISDGLTRAGFIRAWTHPLVGNWHPLTSFSLMLDAQIFGLNPGGYHFVNLLFHSANVLLLFFVLRAMTGALWRSVFVAALFAIHPLRAESVVWISERKDVLSGFFFCLCIGAYCRYAKKRPSLSRYLTVAGALALGLLSKAMLVTVPFLLLLLDYWPLGRFRFSPVAPAGSTDAPPPATTLWLVLEKLPLLALAAATSLATVFAQEPALKAAQDWPLRWRVDNALVTIWIYLRQMFWPTELAVFYPHPKGHLSLTIVGLALLALLAVTAAVLLWRKKHPYLVTGWFWYLGMLVPVIGLMQVGWQAHADRYTYLPQIGISLLVVWGLTDLTTAWRSRRFVLGGLGLAWIAILMTIAHVQTGLWKDSVRLWRHTLAVTTENDVAERGLGTALLKVGQVDEAIAHDREALRIRPGDANGLTNLANALLQKKELPEAIEHYREVVRLRPDDSEVRRNLGKALAQNGAPEQAAEEFRAALKIKPDDSDAAYSLGNLLLEQGRAEESFAWFRQAIRAKANNLAAHYNLAIALSRTNRADEAIAEFRETIRLQPRHADAHNNLAIALLKEGQVEAAIAEWHQALQIQPGNADIHNNLAVALLREKQLEAAIAEWRETLRLQPDKAGTALSLAWILATSPESAMRNGSEALTLAQRAYRIAGERNLMIFRVLAAAYAELGQFPVAIEVAQKGAERAGEHPAIARLLQGDLALYRESIPLRDPSHGLGAEAAP